jgi:P27 family predicted phage terminase small subunit
MRGRKPVPNVLKLHRGNPGRRPIRPDVDVPDGLPAAPEHLDAVAMKEWNRIAPLLLKSRLLSGIDGAALGAYCTAYSRWAQAERMLQKTGLLVKAPSGYPIISPYVSISNKAMSQMTKMLVEFGMSPSSRARVAPGVTPRGESASKVQSWAQRALELRRNVGRKGR